MQRQKDIGFCPGEAHGPVTGPKCLGYESWLISSSGCATKAVCFHFLSKRRNASVSSFPFKHLENSIIVILEGHSLHCASVVEKF